MPEHVAKGSSAYLFETSSQDISPWLLVFDLDGTLIDSSRDLCSSVNAALGHVGRPPLSLPVISSLIGDGAAALVRRALDVSAAAHDSNGPDARDAIFTTAYAEFLAFYREHKLDTTDTYPGVHRALREIRQRRPDLPMAVLTNKPVRPSREICSALELSPFLFANYGGDSFATKKPEPEGLLTIISEARTLLGSIRQSTRDLTSAGVVVVGDSPADVLVARACRARSLGCLYGLAPEELKRSKPDKLVSAPSEWIEALELGSGEYEPLKAEAPTH